MEGVTRMRCTNWSGFETGSGFHSAARIRVNTAVLAPIPRASESMATNVNPGLLRSTRDAYRRSCQSDSMNPRVFIR